MQVDRIDFSVIEMMFRGRKFCVLSVLIDNTDEMEIKRRDKTIEFLFKNGDLKKLSFDEGIEIIKRLKPLLKDLKENLRYCNILDNAIFIKYKEI